MSVTTIKRNGVFIIFPTRENVSIKRNKPIPDTHPVYPSRIKQRDRRPEYHRNSANCKSLQVIGKRCWHCSAPVWRNDVNYCWDCYKYENYESK